jgi:hypothetical protein
MEMIHKQDPQAQQAVPFWVWETKKLQNRRTRFSSHKKLDDFCVHPLLKFNDLVLMMESLEGIIIKLHVTTSQITWGLL